MIVYFKFIEKAGDIECKILSIDEAINPSTLEDVIELCEMIGIVEVGAIYRYDDNGEEFHKLTKRITEPKALKREEESPHIAFFYFDGSFWESKEIE